MNKLNNITFLEINMKQRLPIKVNHKIRQSNNSLKQIKFIFFVLNISPFAHMYKAITKCKNFRSHNLQIPCIIFKYFSLVIKLQN